MASAPSVRTRTTEAFRAYLSALSASAPRAVMTLPSPSAHLGRWEDRLPDALLGLHDVHNGEGRGPGPRPSFSTMLFRHSAFLSLDQGFHSIDAQRLHTEALGQQWIPFGGDGAGSWHGIYPSTHPEHPGAIVHYDSAKGERVVASDMVDFLEGLTKKLKRKRWKPSDDVIALLSAKLYAPDCLPLGNIVPHPELVEAHIHVTRHPVSADDAQRMLERQPGPQWALMVENSGDVQGVKLVWEDEQQRMAFPAWMRHTIKRVDNKSQRHHIFCEPVGGAKAMHLNIIIERSAP